MCKQSQKLACVACTIFNKQPLCNLDPHHISLMTVQEDRKDEKSDSLHCFTLCFHLILNYHAVTLIRGEIYIFFNQFEHCLKTFLMWSIFKVFIEFVTILHLLSMFCFLLCFDYPKACEIQLPNQGLSPHWPPLEAKVLTTEPPGKSLTTLFRSVAPPPPRDSKELHHPDKLSLTTRLYHSTFHVILGSHPSSFSCTFSSNLPSLF